MKFVNNQTQAQSHGQRSWKKLILLLVGGLGLVAAFSFTLWYFQEPTFTSPLSSLTTFNFIEEFIPRARDKKEVYGFLPYWNLKEVELEPELTQLAYFGLTLGADGHVLTTTQNQTPEPGYQRLKSDRLLSLAQELEAQNKQNFGQFEIVLAQFDNETIKSLLNNVKSQENLLQSLDSILLAYPINGINLDLEYSGQVTPELRQQLTELVAAIDQHLDQKYDGVRLSLDLYAAAASKNMLWDVPALEPYLDRIIVMAYDFHRANSPQAGPVAPLFGGKTNWESDINQNLAEFARQVPPEKILLGVPFYGYQWQTTSRQAQAKTFPQSGQTVEFNEIQDILAKKDEYQVEQHWHQAALSPYLTYQQADKTYVVHYENSRSLSYKLDYVNQLDLAGVAIWALGYEDGQRELWDVVKRKFDAAD